ncbi:MAG: hypothetical protein L6420_05600 [Elusimicrobia bacterium]|nr:hypothetical protein [Candidatus Omnitrophota bacterium]MCG2725719.1 hypothetical protein [Elusimicrobiota bacterium]
MKKANVLISIILTAGILCCNGGLIMATEIVKIPGGTFVSLQLLETVSSETAEMGQRIQFAVLSDVYIEGKTVIKKGAQAIGEVTNVSAAGMAGAAGSLTIALQMVQSVDGTMIPISSTKGGKGESKLATSVAVSLICCIFAIFMKGKNVTYATGTMYNAYTLGLVEVKVK